MAQAVQSSNNIIDLTGDDENDDSIVRAHAACEKAFMAASRLTNHFESFRTPKPIAYQRPNETVDSTNKDSLSDTVPPPLTLPWLRAVEKAARSETDGLKKSEKSNVVPRQKFSPHDPGVSASQSAPVIATSNLAKSPSILESTEGNKQEPREKKSRTPGIDTFTVRTPRSAAIHAKQNIAETCSELEEWVNKESKIISQQAGVGTPRRQGKRNYDLDEWSPTSNTKNKYEERKGLGRTPTISPTLWAGKYEDLTAKGEQSWPETSTTLGTKKRRLSGSPPPSDSPVKVARLGEKANAHYDSTHPSSPEPANGKHVHDEAGSNSTAGIFSKFVYPTIKAAKAEYKQSFTEDEVTGIGKSITNDIEDLPRGLTPPFLENDPQTSQLERNSPGKSTVKMNEKPPSEPSNVNLGKDDTTAEATMLHTQKRIDPGCQQGLHVASDPTTFEPGPCPASPGHGRYSILFDSVVYPTIKKSKKRHKNSLPREDLDAIGVDIISEVLKRLASSSEDACQLSEDTKEKIKHFIPKLFRKNVRRANAQSSHNSATPVNGSRLGIASLSSGLESTPGVLHPPAPCLDQVETVLSSRTGDETEEALAPRQPNSKSIDQPLSSPAQESPNESLTSALEPDFDRGRYPAMRRRRGNKYYTPPKASKTGFNLDNGHSMSSEHNNYLELSSGKDHVRFSKALANQPESLRTSTIQLATSTGATEKNRTPTNQDSALEPSASIDEVTVIEHVASEPASYADASKALQQISGHGQRRITDFIKTPSSSLGPISSHIAKSQTDTAINQSAQQTHRDILLEDTSPPKETRPHRPKPATALDPGLEHVVAVLVTEGSNGPSQDGQRYSITPKNQLQLITDHSIVKHVDLSSRTEKPNLVRIETKMVDPVRRPESCISSLLRNRELGLTSRGRHVGTIADLRQLNSEKIEPWKNWKGASGDVVAVAWNPDSNVYAFGAAAHTNIEDLQYNRPCNLLLGNLISNQIRELPDHRIDRPKPETIPSGSNSTRAVYDACDPNVYETVTSIAFAPTGDRMFTASHDCTVKIWDVSADNYQCLSTLRHEAWVTSVEISEHHQGLFATASKCVKDAVRIYNDESCYVNFSASRAAMRPEWKIYPECLRWGPNPYTSHLLLAGFQQWGQQGDLLSRGGQLCLWDAYAFESIKVTPSSQSIYAAAWHPSQLFFATGGAPGSNLTDKINTKTVVRVWDVRTPKHCQVEYECPAADMQDITFCPSNPNIVTAGCTDGSSYVWDWRCPDQLLHHLKHGRPLWELDHTKEREEADTGVMLSLWSPGGTLFYTGSSDGVIKTWDYRRHPNDVLINNVANLNVSIISGAFSPDGNNLLVGDAEGGIHVLSSAPCVRRSNSKSTDAHIDLVRAPNGSGLKLDEKDDNPGTEGIEAARSLVKSGQLEYHKDFGIGKGPNYQGPYAGYARKEAAESGVGRLRKKFEKTQPISKKGKKRWDIAVPMTSLLFERKQTLGRGKDGDQMALDSSSEGERKTTPGSKDGKPPPKSPLCSSPEGALGVGGRTTGVEEDANVDYNTISESEMVEENHWWSRMGEKEIDQARAGSMNG